MGSPAVDFHSSSLVDFFVEFLVSARQTSLRLLDHMKVLTVLHGSLLFRFVDKDIFLWLIMVVEFRRVGIARRILEWRHICVTVLVDLAIVVDHRLSVVLLRSKLIHASNVWQFWHRLDVAGVPSVIWHCVRARVFVVVVHWLIVVGFGFVFVGRRTAVTIAGWVGWMGWPMGPRLIGLLVLVVVVVIVKPGSGWAMVSRRWNSSFYWLPVL